jgi:hypothetical protein
MNNQHGTLQPYFSIVLEKMLPEVGLIFQADPAKFL